MKRNLFVALCIVLLTSACGSPAKPAPTQAPAATTAPVATQAPAATPVTVSAFEPIPANIVAMAPAGRTNWTAFYIMPISNGSFTFYGSPFKEKGIHVPTASGGVVANRPQGIAIEVEEGVPQGTYYGQARLKDANGVEQDFTITLKVSGPCDFIVRAQKGLPETFVTMTTATTDITIGTAHIHAACIDGYPVYTVAVPDQNCLADTIQYGEDGTWGCYYSDHMWVSVMGGIWVAPYGKPQGWQEPAPDVEKMFPPDLLTPQPSLPVQQG